AKRSAPNPASPSPGRRVCPSSRRPDAPPAPTPGAWPASRPRSSARHSSSAFVEAKLGAEADVVGAVAGPVVEHHPLLPHGARREDPCALAEAVGPLLLPPLDGVGE